MTSSTQYGFALRTADDTPDFLPLKSVSVTASIVDISAQVELTQVYSNSSALKNSEARYLFPVPANAAVCAFSMETAEGRIRAVVKEKEIASREYENAVSKGKWAGLLEQVTGDVFVVSVGSIPKGEDVMVKITYVEELPLDNLVNQVRFVLPAFITERYGHAPSELHQPSSSNLALLHLNVDVQMASLIQKIVSPSHEIESTNPVKVSSGAGHAPVYKANVIFAPSAGSVALVKDFILTVQAASLHKPRCLASPSSSRNSVAMSLTLVPQFGIPPVSFQEYVFIIDRSGSMRGSSIQFAKNALTILLKSLPEKCTCFNIASFGNQFEMLWEVSQPYGEESLKEAVHYVQSMTANMGGTEINSVLSCVFQSRAQNIPTSVFVLTDGEVWNTQEILNATRTAVTNAGPASKDSNTYLRVFTLGIGHGASTELCQGLARTGNGLCYMVANDADIPSRCSSLLRAARVPPIGSLWGISVDWGHSALRGGREDNSGRATEIGKENDGEPSEVDAKTFSFFDESLGTPEEISNSGTAARAKSTYADLVNPFARLVRQAPTKVPEIYPFSRFVVSAILQDTTQVPESVTLKGVLPGTDEEITMVFQVQRVEEDTSLLHTLAARRLITDLQDGNYSALGLTGPTLNLQAQDQVKDEIVRLSIEYQLASEYTAFIAVENTSKESHVQDEDRWIEVEIVKPPERVNQVIRGRKAGRYARRRSTARMSTGGKAPRKQLQQAACKSSVAVAAGSSGESVRKIRNFVDVSGKSDSSDQGHINPVAQGGRSANKGADDAVEISAKRTRAQPPRNAKRRASDGPSQMTGPEAHLDPVRIALIQDHSGSFRLTEEIIGLLALGHSRIQNQTGSGSSAKRPEPTLANMKQYIPNDLSDCDDRDEVWATLLVAALMRKYMDDTRQIWLGIWEKAREYVVGKIGGDEGAFMMMLEEAERII